MVYLIPHKADSKLKSEYKIPQIVVSLCALQKMSLYVEHNDKEVGWLGSVTKTDDVLFVNDVYLFRQEVETSTCEITPDGLTEFGTELLNKPNGMDLYNSIRLWGHSHVNMDVSPSGQDNTQMEAFKKSGCDWFIRVIANKHGKMGVTFYDYANKMTVEDAPWTLEALNITGLEEQVKQEIKDKVKDLVYKNTGNVYGGSHNSYYRNGINTDWYNRYNNTGYDYYDDIEDIKEHTTSTGTWIGNQFFPWATLGFASLEEYEKVRDEKLFRSAQEANGISAKSMTYAPYSEIEDAEVDYQVGKWCGCPLVNITSDIAVQMYFDDNFLYTIATEHDAKSIEDKIHKALEFVADGQLYVTDASVKFIHEYAVELFNAALEK